MVGWHRRYDGAFRRANMGFTVFMMSTFAGASAEAMELLDTLRKKLVESHGKREGLLLAHDASERIAVACTLAVGAQLLEGTAGPTEEVPATRMPREDDDPEDCRDTHIRKWREWALAHGLEPAPPVWIDGSLGLRVITRS